MAQKELQLCFLPSSGGWTCDSSASSPLLLSPQEPSEELSDSLLLLPKSNLKFDKLFQKNTAIIEIEEEFSTCVLKL